MDDLKSVMQLTGTFESVCFQETAYFINESAHIIQRYYKSVNMYPDLLF